jgi:hypothetical protein
MYVFWKYDKYAIWGCVPSYILLAVMYSNFFPLATISLTDLLPVFTVAVGNYTVLWTIVNFVNYFFLFMYVCNMHRAEYIYSNVGNCITKWTIVYV